jgi:uncharacterized protein (TIGR03083 family)
VQLTPHYGPDPIVVLDGPADAIVAPAVRHYRRLVAALAGLTEEQWAQPTRCDGWDGVDVVVHLETATSFWALSIAAGCQGEPTRFLATFDPVATPAAMVAASGAPSSGEALGRLAAAIDALVGVIEGLDDAGLSALAEAPPGHIAVSALLHHALWDSWVHERDVLLPLGIAVDEEPDEVEACLRYAAALGPVFHLNQGRPERGTFGVRTTTPDARLLVDVGDRVEVRAGEGDVELCLTGPGVDLVEALSIRRPFDQPVPEGWGWALAGLAEQFDSQPA